MDRRAFLKRAGVGAAGLFACGAAGEAARPNILWITCEDMGPHLGCFGDAFAVTPNLDALAAVGVRYTHAFTHAPVCAPSRSGLITGVYPTTLGSHHMRSKAPLPAEVRCFTQYLREAGYYCSNNNKEDYNFEKPAGSWDDSSKGAHWRNRAKGQPFFSVFNLTTTHEGQIRLDDRAFAARTRELTAGERHDPAKVAVPPYHPDTPEARKDWAQYYDLITVMDKEAGRILDELEQDGLAGDTIVFFFPDHGAGMPRCKRWLYDSGLRVPLILRFPEKHRALAPLDSMPASIDRLVTFVDFAPTVLSLAGVRIPGHMQGYAFLGPAAGEAREYVFGGRDRMDERYDCCRMARDMRYKYIRNLMPHLSRGQFQEYSYHMPTMQAWAALKRAGKLEGPAALFMQDEKPVEELYDTTDDPFELNNLAGDARHSEALERMRGALAGWMREARDLGLLHESEMHKRAVGRAIYDFGKDAAAFPMVRLMETAGIESGRVPDEQDLVGLLADADGAVRYQAVMGLYQYAGRRDGAPEWLDAAQGLMSDASPSVCVAAAGLLYRYRSEAALAVLMDGLRSDDEWVRLQAANIVDLLGDAGKPALDVFRALVNDPNQYVVRVAKHAVGVLG